MDDTAIQRSELISAGPPCAPGRGFRPAVVAPTYNNARTLAEILARLEALRLPVIAVDDGSSDDTPAILAAWSGDQCDRGGPCDGGDQCDHCNRGDRGDRLVLTHGENLGKAAALKTGLAACRRAGYTHAVSIDTDGQLAPEDVPRLLAVAMLHPTALILGTRSEQCAGYPFRSRWGRRISNGFVRLECGQRVDDSQCGLRLYPLDQIEPGGCVAGRYGFETEVIVRAAWRGVPMRGVPVECIYLPPGQRVSHFKPWRDSARALAMHGRLLGRSLMPWTDGGQITRSTLLIHRGRARIHSAGRSVNPLSAWRSLRSEQVSRKNFAAAFAIGVFIANLPLYGIQTISGLLAARRLKLHPLAVVAGTQLSMPPIGPLLIAASIITGHLLLHGTMLTWGIMLNQVHHHATAAIGSMLLDWIVGSVCVGAVLASAAFAGLRLLLHAAMARPDREGEPKDRKSGDRKARGRKSGQRKSSATPIAA